MATKTFYVKDHEGLTHSPIRQLPSVTWWGAISTPEEGCTDLCGQLKHLTAGQIAAGLTVAKQVGRGMEQGSEKVNPTQFTIFPGDFKTSNDSTKPLQPALSLQTILPEYGGTYNLGLGQPVICAKFPSIDHHYGLFSAYGTQISGRIMLPMSLTTDDGPIFVNPKQYHGIIRRRKSRAKAVLENKVTRNRQPYMHYSRHLHAMRRARGDGGRFLNTKKSDCGQDRIGEKRTCDIQLLQPAGSQSSEVLQSDSGTMNSSQDANGGASNVSGSEVTSMYSRGDLEQFKFNHHLPPVHRLSGMISNRHCIVMPSKRVAAADNCCNLQPQSLTARNIGTGV